MYKEAMNYIENSFYKNNKKGNDILLKFLNKIDNPQKKLKVIHVAGTNAKGSTCITLNNILIINGYKTGLFTSPHIEKYNERIKINSIDISDDDFLKYIMEIKDLSNKFFNNDYDTFSFLK